MIEGLLLQHIQHMTNLLNLSVESYWVLSAPCKLYIICTKQSFAFLHTPYSDAHRNLDPFKAFFEDLHYNLNLQGFPKNISSPQQPILALDNS